MTQLSVSEQQQGYVGQVSRRLPKKFGGLSTARRVEAVFKAFLAEFRGRGARYHASGPDPDVAMALHGGMLPKKASMACQHFSRCLRAVFEDAMGDEVTCQYEEFRRPFITRSFAVKHANVRGAYQCIDANVTGNIRTSKGVRARCCLFESHVAVRVTGGGVNRIYDPTLMCSCSGQDDIRLGKLEWDADAGAFRTRLSATEQLYFQPRDMLATGKGAFSKKAKPVKGFTKGFQAFRRTEVQEE